LRSKAASILEIQDHSNAARTTEWSTPFTVDAKFSQLLSFAMETFRMIARLYVGLSCAGAVVLTLISPWLVQWLTAPEFHYAQPIVGVLAWQAVFYWFYLIVLSGIWKVEKTNPYFYLIGGAAILGMLLNWLMVPPWVILGAAASIAFTYAVWIAMVIGVSEPLWSVGYKKNC